MESKKRMSRAEAAAYISENHFPCAPQTLANRASSGGGPKFRKVANGRTIYESGDCDAWARAQTSKAVTSTAELAQTAAA